MVHIVSIQVLNMGIFFLILYNKPIKVKLYPEVSIELVGNIAGITKNNRNDGWVTIVIGPMNYTSRQG